MFNSNEQKQAINYLHQFMYVFGFPQKQPCIHTNNYKNTMKVCICLLSVFFSLLSVIVSLLSVIVCLLSVIVCLLSVVDGSCRLLSVISTTDKCLIGYLRVKKVRRK